MSIVLKKSQAKKNKKLKESIRDQPGESVNGATIETDATRSNTPANFKDLTGKRISKYTVINRNFDGEKWRVRWNCVCDCGIKKVFLSAKLLSIMRSKTEIGCQCDKVKCFTKKKGGLINTYRGMIKRCYHKSDKRYKDYGGRGIYVCDEWLGSYEKFKDDMGEKPTNEHTLDRINNDGPYSKENCRWATRKEQMRNMRRTVYIDGKPISQIAEETGIKHSTLFARYQRGFNGDFKEKPRGKERCWGRSDKGSRSTTEESAIEA